MRSKLLAVNCCGTIYAASSFRLRCANAPYELKRALITNLMRSKLLKNTLLVQLLDKHSINAVLLVVYQQAVC